MCEANSEGKWGQFYLIRSNEESHSGSPKTLQKILQLRYSWWPTSVDVSALAFLDHGGRKRQDSLKESTKMSFEKKSQIIVFSMTIYDLNRMPIMILMPSLWYAKLAVLSWLTWQGDTKTQPPEQTVFYFWIYFYNIKTGDFNFLQFFLFHLNL